MRSKTILIFIFVLISIGIYSYDIQQISITFIDPARNNRQIPTQIFIPVESEAMRNGAEREESFPFIVFGHGWIQSYTVYQSVWQALVPTGWIMAFPTTEGNLFPSHNNFALDIAFLSFAIVQTGEDPNSPLYGLVQPLSVAMGHSMGGGASILAASYNNGFSAVATLAAADTNPSAINAALNVEMPSLTFSGTSDSITPPASHQIPIYNNLASVYKSFVSLNGVTHTGIYNNNIVFNLMEQWLDYLKTYRMIHINDFHDLLDLYDAAGQITYLLEYTLISPASPEITINEGGVSLSWDFVPFAGYYIVEMSENTGSDFVQISQSDDIFNEDEGRVFWTFDTDEPEPRMFFRVKAAGLH